MFIGGIVGLFIGSIAITLSLCGVSFVPENAIHVLPKPLCAVLTAGDTDATVMVMIAFYIPLLPFMIAAGPVMGSLTEMGGSAFTIVAQVMLFVVPPVGYATYAYLLLVLIRRRSVSAEKSSGGLQPTETRAAGVAWWKK